MVCRFLEAVISRYRNERKHQMFDERTECNSVSLNTNAIIIVSVLRLCVYSLTLQYQRVDLLTVDATITVQWLSLNQLRHLLLP